MSIWADLQDRCSGEVTRKEDDILIYHKPDKESQTLTEDTYNDFKFKIESNGAYPVVTIFPPNVVSCFAGASVAVLKIDGHFYELSRKVNFGQTKFIYEFNKEKDYVYGEAEKRHWTLPDLIDISKKFIDEIIDSERVFVYDMNKS